MKNKTDKIPCHLTYESTMKLEKKMNHWLEKDYVPEDTKATMHAQQLQRVKQLNNQVLRPEPSPVQMIRQTERTMTSESDSVSPSHATEKQIIDSVPKTMQNRAKLLIIKLKDHSDISVGTIMDS